MTQEDRQLDVNSQKRHRFLLLLVCIGLTIGIFIAYEPIRFNGFVNYDDSVYITENPDVKNGISVKSLTWALTQFHNKMWHPLTTLSHLIDCQLYGLHPLGHHLTNVVIHLVNTLLLFFILRKLTSSLWLSAFIAAVFALHPLQVESVAWASERKTVLAGLFSFLTIAIYLWYVKKPVIKRYIPLFLIYALCITTKPSVVTLPFVLLLLDYWPLERLDLEHRSKNAVPLKKLILEKIPLIALALILCVLTLVAQQQGQVIVPLENMPLKYRLGNAFISYISYIGKLIYPANLAVLYPHPFEKVSINSSIICSLLFMAATVLALYYARKRKYLIVGWLWFAGTLVPMAGIIQSGVQAMADRYMYLSMLGLLFIIALFSKEIIEKMQHLKPLFIILSAFSITAMIIISRIQVGYWQNGLTLFEHTLKVTKDNAIAQCNYGNALFRAGKLDESIEHLKNAIKIVPAYPLARINLGKALLKQGKAEEAIACFKSLSDYADEKEDMYASLGAAYTITGKFEPAYENLTKAKELKPDDPDVLNNLAWLLVAIGDNPSQDCNKAMEYAKRACELTNNENADYLDSLAASYAAAGKFSEAVAAAEKGLDIAKARGNKGLEQSIQSHLEFYRANKPYREK